MKTLSRRMLVWLPIALILMLVAFLPLADAWLESAGGRERLERELSRRVGMPVHLLGDFKLSLWPGIGVSGTDLVIGQPGQSSEFSRSSEFELAVELRPLMNRQLKVQQVRVTGITIYPDRLRAGVTGSTASPIRVDSLGIVGFAPYTETAFTLELKETGSAAGSFNWQPQRSSIYFSALTLVTAGGEVSGQGCLSLRPNPLLQLTLQAASLDIDAIRSSLPAIGGSESDATFDARIQLRAQELKTGGAIARDVNFRLGDLPDCGAVESG